MMYVLYYYNSDRTISYFSYLDRKFSCDWWLLLDVHMVVFLIISQLHSIFSLVPF